MKPGIELRMNHLRCLSIGLLVLGFSTPVAAQLGLNAGPMIWMDERVVDFGEMKQADYATHVFSFENRGTETIFKPLENDWGESGRARPDKAERLTRGAIFVCSHQQNLMNRRYRRVPCS